MTVGTAIAWTDNTFNYILGCQKVAQECKFCYAERDSERFHPGETLWGPPQTSIRKTLSATYWKQPLTWERKALALGKTIKVFSSSWADICEDHPIAHQERPRLIQAIEQTPHLTWQLLTKRPENYASMFWPTWPEHVWAMTSAGSPTSAEKMIPELMKVDAAIRGVSVEPLIENFSLVPYLPFLDWVIIGGESGREARPMPLAWVEQMIADCEDAGVAVFVKQLGSVYSRNQGYGHSHATNTNLWPDDLRIQQFPTIRANRRIPYSGLIKKEYYANI